MNRTNGAYSAIRKADGTPVITTPKDCELKLEPSLKIWNHSPTGFEWGYGGSGPAQLALAILLDYSRNVELAVRNHQKFKWSFIAPALHDGFTITKVEIKTWLEKQTERETCDA